MGIAQLEWLGVTDGRLGVIYRFVMPWGLKRYYGTDGLHFITSSCYQRRPLLASPERRDLLLAVLERMRERYRFAVVGYVVMPEHFHLLISEPEVGTPSTVMQAVKLGFAKRVLNRVSASRAPLLAKDARNGAPVARVVPANRGGRPHHVWQARFYDFNVWSQRKEIEKLGYMHSNPVERGLVLEPGLWAWSSFRWYASGELGAVRLNDWSWLEHRIRAKMG